MAEQVVISSDGQLGLVHTKEPDHLRRAVILRIGQLKDDRDNVRRYMESRANPGDFVPLRKLDKLLTITIIELEKAL